MDPTRTKPGAGVAGASPRTGATTCSRPRLMLLHDDDDSCAPVAVPITFGEWVDEGIAGRRPTLADLDYHCTTLFPPVRPRGWLEVRWLDCLPAGLAEVGQRRRHRAAHRRARPATTALEACAAVDRVRLVDHHRQPRHRTTPTLAAAGGGSLARRRRGARPHGRPAALGRGRRRRRPSAGRPRAARRPTTSRTGCAAGATVLELADPPEEVRVAVTDADAPTLAAALDESRARFLAILEPFDEPVLRRQHDVLMSPLLWDLAHVANYEDLWLVRALGGEPTRAGLDDLYDAFKQPRRRAGGAAAARPRRGAAPTATRCGPGRSTGSPRADLGPTARPAAAPRLRPPDGRPARAPARRDAARRDPAAARRRGPRRSTRRRRRRRRGRAAGRGARARRAVPRWAPTTRAASTTSGPSTSSTCRRSGSTPRPSPTGSTGVRRGRRLRRPALVERPAGWAWRQEAGLVAPQFWRRDGDGWARLAVRRRRAAARRRARAARRLVRGRRLRPLGRQAPAHRGRVGEGGRFDPPPAQPPLAVGRRRAHRRHANLGQRHLGPAPVGAYPDGVSAVGCHQMVGDVWEWTVERLPRLPGLRVAFPYAEYSEVFYGDDYKVLRGGSWATHPQRRPRHLPQLGPPDPPPDLRRLPLAHGTLADVPPPRLPRARRRSLSSLLYDAEHSLERQSWKPRASARAP